MNKSSRASAWRQDVEAIVRSSLGPASGLVVSASVEEDGYLILTFHTSSSTTAAPTHTERAEARIGTTGTGWILLDLDGRFELREWYGDPEEERKTLTLLARLAEAYLAGKGRDELKGAAFGRRRSELTLELDGETYVFKKA
ncbi:MAG: hypothetical protein HHJ11_01570 [Phycicoccus sp.]|nr:hypothetical protein [Phycicoccus sp.]